jgi:hypothetical protein
MLITNTSRALQGVHSTSGLVFIGAGKTMDVDVAPDYLDRLKSLPFLTVGGKAADTTADAKFVDGRDANGDTPEMAQLRGMFNSSWNALQAEHSKAKVDLEAAQTEITTLKDRIAELELENEELTKLVPAPVIPEAKHRGAGSYSIMEGETELREKLTKDQAEAFNKLDAEGKAKWLADNPKAVA